MRGKLMTLAGAAILALGVSTAPGQAAAATEAHYESRSWPFYGLFGTYDRAALQRGFQVYQEVCAACHGLKRVAFRHLADIGFSEAEVKAIAASHQVTDGPDEAGDMFERPGLPSDHFVSPFANDNAARAANNGALPPDLSLIVKARMGGPDYIYGVLSGYAEAPAGTAIPEGMSYNTAFAGNQIAMPPPLADGQVTYADGTEASVAQMAEDVTSFLAWSAETKLEERKRVGFKVMVFLIVFTGLLYWIKRRVWQNVH